MTQIILYNFTLKVPQFTLTKWQFLKSGLKVCHFAFGKFVISWTLKV